MILVDGKWLFAFFYLESALVLCEMIDGCILKVATSRCEHTNE